MAIDLGDIPSGTSPSPAEKLQIRSAIGVGQTDAPTFLAQTLTGQSLTGTQATSLVDLSATWNTTGTPTALKLNVTDTASNFSALLLDCQTGGTSRFRVTKNGAAVAQTTADNGGVFSAGSNGFKNIQFGGLTYNSNGMVAIRDPGLVVVRDLGGFCWENGTQNPATGTIELSLFKDAAGILAQRNGTNAQAFRVYNTYTDASNYDRLSFFHSSGQATISAEGAGTGLAGSHLSLKATGATKAIIFFTAGLERWAINSSGNLTAQVDNTCDIGTSGGYRPRNIYVGTSVFTGIGGINFDVNARIRSPADSIVTLYNSALTDFSRLQLGGTTSAFPAIKRNGTGIDIRLADDSGFAAVKGKITTDTNYTVGAFSPTGFLTLYDATGTAYKVACSVYP